MTVRIVEIVLLPIAWSLLILAALQTKLLVSAADHSICGPWGCGPATDALVAMHSGWLAVIGPPVIYFAWRLKWSTKTIRRISAGLFAVGVTGLAAIVAWQWLVWLPQAGAFSKDYIWQRCGFAFVTAVDWPLIALLVLSIILQITAAIAPITGRKRSPLRL